MISVILRLVSLVLVLAALALLGIDAVTSLGHSGQITVRSLEAVWRLLDPAGLVHFNAWLASAYPALANGVHSVLLLPGWGVTGVAGVLIAFLAGRNTPP